MKPPRSELLLRGEAVTVRLGKALVVDSANLTLRAGEFVALVGPNGAGKTTLMRALAGLQPARGKIELRERRLDSFGPRERARSIAYLPQGHVFYWPVSAASVVGLGRYPHADAFSRPSPEDATAVSRALKATGLEPLADRRVTTLSGGERARVALARALATEAPIVFADEPTASLDPRHQLLVMEMLRRTTRTGAAVLAILHDITLAARFADRIVLMDGGRIVADGLPADALNPAQIAKVFGVEAIDVDIGEGVVPVLRRPI